MSQNVFISLLRIAAVASLLSGCTRSVESGPGAVSNLKAWVAEVSSRPSPPLEPLPVMQQFETFQYNDQGLRDPFSDVWSTNQNTTNGSIRPDPNRRKQPLESFPLDSLKMVGTIGTGSNMVAVVTAPDKVTYTVHPGMYMGQNDGRVTGVRADRVELMELVPDGSGGWLERPATLALDDD